MLKIKKIASLALILNFIILSTANAETGMGLYKPQTILPSTQAEVTNPADKIFSADINGGTISLSEGFNLEYPAETLTADAVIKLTKIDSKINLPWNLKKISSVFSFDITPSVKPAKQLTITIPYTPGNTQFKQVYYFDTVKKTWLALPTTDYSKDSQVKALVNIPSAMLAVFAKPGTLTIGKASWYKYKGGDFAASPDFPKGSRLRVTNLANNKSVEVVVNDWGPERVKHPERAIDLDKVAFAKIASTGDGVINVSVSPIKLSADKNGRVLGVKAEGINSEPKIASKSVVIVNETDGQTWMEKNSDNVRPIASLTKVVAMSVYLSLKPDLDRMVDYKTADEKQNLRYCNSWENTKVNLKDGARMPAKDLFNSAIVGSANNAVEALVRNSGISRDKFIALMNSTVADWGATHTKFVEPTGLSNKNVSSAKDYAIIVGQAMKNKDLAAASIRPSYAFTASDKIKHNLKNTNKLIVEQAQLNLRAEQYPIISSKTGYLNEAGYCLMTRVKQGDNNYTIVTLGAPTRADSFTDMADLINYLKFKITWI